MYFYHICFIGGESRSQGRGAANERGRGADDDDSVSEDLYKMSDESFKEVNMGDDFDMHDDTNINENNNFADSEALRRLKIFYMRNECLQSVIRCGKWQRRHSNKMVWVKITDGDNN